MVRLSSKAILKFRRDTIAYLCKKYFTITGPTLVDSLLRFTTNYLRYFNAHSSRYDALIKAHCSIGCMMQLCIFMTLGADQSTNSFLVPYK